MFSGLLNLFGCNRQGAKAGNDKDMDAILASVEAFKKRPIHKELTKSILDGLPDDQLEQAVYDNISEIIGEDYENELSNVKKLTKGQKAIFSTWAVEAEVNNGGFNQFYFNSSGQYGDMAVEGFETVDATKHAELMREANKIYASIKKDLEKFDDGTVESFSESYEDNPLNKLDDKYYDLDKNESLWGLKVKYIREHPEQFTQK